MQKFLQKFITVCAVIIGVVALIEGAQHLVGYFKGDKTVGYIEKVQSIAEKTVVIMNDVAPFFQADTKATKEEILNKVTEAKKELIHLNEKAQKLDSPQNMQAMHQKFLGSLQDYVSAFQLTEEGFKTGDDAKIGQAGDLLTKGAHEMQGVATELARH